MARPVGAQLRELAQAYPERAEKVLEASFLEITGMMILQSPVRDGYFRNSWRAGINEIDTSVATVASAAISSSTGSVRQALNRLDLGAAFYFTNSLPYAHRIEFEGWSQQAPNGVVRVNLLKLDGIVERNIGRFAG